MPLDALCLSGLVRELDQTVTGGKIDKIYQPGRDEVILALRTPAQGNVRLLLSANPEPSQAPADPADPGRTRTPPPMLLYAPAQAPVRRAHPVGGPAPAGARGHP